MGTHQYKYPSLSVPKDDQGYVVEFSINQESEYLDFFNKYGVVVVKNVITDEQADKTADEVWGSLKKTHSCELNDPDTWQNWPWGGHLGILGNDFIMTPHACDNRQNPVIHRVFSVLFGTERLIVSLDRVGMMRPTKQIKYSNSDELVDRPDWKSKLGWLHWDMNPWTGRTSIYGWGGNYPLNPEAMDITNNGYDILKVQGILALYDCGEKEGGLHGVPGFHHDMKQWAEDHKDMAYKNCYPDSIDETTVQVPKDDPLRNYIQTLPIRKGSMLIWNSMIPHGTHPNDSDKFRLIQYVKMAPENDPAITPATKCTYLPQSWITVPDDVKLTSLGKKLYGIQSWDAEEESARRFRINLFLLGAASAIVGILAKYMW